MDGHADMAGMPHKQTDSMTMHMSFYWGHQAEIIFPGWPGRSTGKYILTLLLVFVLTVLIEWLSRSRKVVKGCDGNDGVSRVLRTVLHGLRMGLAYVVMLAVMSFNVGVFIVVVFGHGVGYLVFGSGSGSDSDGKNHHSDLGTTTC